MAAETPSTRATGGSTPQEPDREKAFFETWLRLMERLKDAGELTQKLQSVLTQSADLDAKHQANLMSANDKSIAELMKTLNEFFFKDIVPALKRAKKLSASQQRQDPLDQYLEHGEDGAPMPQAFVDNMSGWGAPGTQQPTRSRKKKAAPTGRGGVMGSGDDSTSDDDMSSEMFHDFLISNGMRMIAMQAPDYSAVFPRPAIQQQAATTQAAAPGATSSPMPTASPRGPRTKGKTAPSKRGRTVPPPIVTDLPPTARSGSTPRTKSRSPDEKKDRIGKRNAANLVAEQVLGVRAYKSTKEFMIRWQGLNVPLWIARRKAPDQAKKLIDAYADDLRARENAQHTNQREADPSRKGKKKISRNGTSHRAAAGGGTQKADFYTVDHIVNHRMNGNRREYLVRWESYDASEDTWENADKLRADVPEIVGAYEHNLQRDHTQNEAYASAVSELIRDKSTSSSSKPKKRGKSKIRFSVSGGHTNRGHGKEKRRRVSAGGEANEDDDENTIENDSQFGMEEAEVEEFSEGEFVEMLNS